jgi:hypothetical protein
VFSSDGAKDPNELHKRNPEGFRAAFQAALDRAEPLTPTLHVGAREHHTLYLSTVPVSAHA